MLRYDVNNVQLFPGDEVCWYNGWLRSGKISYITHAGTLMIQEWNYYARCFSGRLRCVKTANVMKVKLIKDDKS
jgi:hypothetical protein